MEWFRKSAEQGYADAQYSLGVGYGDGRGVPQDGAEAAEWYRKATEQGHAEAQANMGSLYASGKGVPQDRAQAYAWFSIAAGQGLRQAARSREVIDLLLMACETREHAQGLAREYCEKYVLPFRN